MVLGGLPLLVDGGVGLSRRILGDLYRYGVRSEV